jgi:hypothetical protein
MPDNNFEEIRNGLTNYMFSCLSAMPYKDKEAKHFLVSILLEEALSISKDENEKIDLFAIKPMLRACNLIFTERLKCLKEIESSDLVIDQINDYNTLIKIISELIDNIKE